MLRPILSATYAGSERIDQPQWDVAVAPAGKLPDPLDSVRQLLAQIAKLPAEQLDQPQVRLARRTPSTSWDSWSRLWRTWIS